LWDATSHRLLRTLEGPPAPVPSLAFAPRAPLLAGGSKGEGRLWAVPDGGERGRLDAGGGGGGGAVSPDGPVVAGGGGGQGRRRAPSRGRGGAGLAAAGAPDGLTLASGGADGPVKRWPARRSP